MADSRRKSYAWAISAGLNAAFAAVSAKLFFPPLVRYSLVVIFNVIMWGCYVNSLKALSSLQATVTNFATNFLTSGLAGFFLFEELLSFKKRCNGNFSLRLIACLLFLVMAWKFLVDRSNHSRRIGEVFEWFAGALFIIIGVLILSKSSVEKKENID